MKKSFVTAAFAALLVFSLAGCGGQFQAGAGVADSIGTSEDELTSAAEESIGSSVDEADKLDAADLNSDKDSLDSSLPGRPGLEMATMYIHETDDNNKLIYVSGRHDSLRISAGSREGYETLAASLDDIMSKETAEVKKQIEDYVQQFKDNPPDSELAPEGYNITDSIYVKRADRLVLSVLESKYSFAGGAHGFAGYSTLNLDAVTGKQIALDDVIADRDGLSEFLKEELVEQYDKTDFFDFMPDTVDQEVKEGDGSLKWTLDPQGITFYFDPYEIGSYAAGPHQVTALYNNNENLFTDQYRPEKNEGYIMDVPAGIDYFMDTDQDGQADRVSLSYEKDEYDTITNMSVSIDDKSFSINSLHCYGIEPKAVWTSDGRAFLYALCSSDNDFVNMYLFDLSSGSPVSMGSMALSEAYTYTDQNSTDYNTYKELLTDPQNMTLSSRFDLLSTYSASKDYYISDSPVPVSDDKYYSIAGDISLVSVKDLAADVVDDDGKIIKESEMIPAGSTFKLLRTDGEKSVDAVLSDGRVVRLMVTGTYPQYINGVDINDLFEQLYFAG